MLFFLALVKQHIFLKMSALFWWKAKDKFTIETVLTAEGGQSNKQMKRGVTMDFRQSEV